MTETLCTSGAVKYKAGANASSTITNDPVAMTQFINQAEGTICAATAINWVDAYAAMNADFKQILEETASDLAAIYVIQYDMSGFTSRIEAEDMINILRDAALRGISIMRNAPTKEFMGVT
jgi:hypothetical protein